MKMLKQKQTGFTLIELLVVVALMGIVVSMAAPSISRTSNKTATKNLTDSITGVITQARILAMSSGTNTVVCPTVDVEAADIECSGWDILAAGAANNQIGWIIFKDPEGDGVYNGNDNDQILSRLVFDDHNGKVGLTVGPVEPISFNRKGIVTTQNIAALEVASRDPDFRGAGFDREIVIEQSTGRIISKIKR